MFLKNVEAFQPKRRRVLKNAWDVSKFPYDSPILPRKTIKVRFSSSWLSVYTKGTDLQSISMTTRGKNGCHWLSEKCMTTNDNENTGWLSEELAESKRVN